MGAAREQTLLFLHRHTADDGGAAEARVGGELPESASVPHAHKVQRIDMTWRKVAETNAPNHLHTLYTCTPSSLVGTTMIANAHVSGGTPSNPALPASASALCITGTAYASVLPLPVSAHPNISRRSRTARGMTAVWMGSGAAKPWGAVVTRVGGCRIRGGAVRVLQTSGGGARAARAGWYHVVDGGGDAAVERDALVPPRHRVGVGTGGVGATFRSNFGFVSLAFFEGDSLRRITNAVAAVAHRCSADLRCTRLALPLLILLQPAVQLFLPLHLARLHHSSKLLFSLPRCCSLRCCCRRRLALGFPGKRFVGEAELLGIGTEFLFSFLHGKHVPNAGNNQHSAACGRHNVVVSLGCFFAVQRLDTHDVADILQRQRYAAGRTVPHWHPTFHFALSMFTRFHGAASMLKPMLICSSCMLDCSGAL
jgi:hypothetical protein